LRVGIRLVYDGISIFVVQEISERCKYFYTKGDKTTAATNVRSKRCWSIRK